MIYVSGKSEGDDIYTMDRGCAAKAKLGCHPVKVFEGVPESTGCYCDTDACNVGRSTATPVTGHHGRTFLLTGLLHMLILLLAQCHNFLPL